MANSVRVKEKSSWKNVEIPHDIINGQDFGGLIEIKELTDYELLTFKTDLSNENLLRTKLSSGKTKKRKHEQETAASVDGKHATPQLMDKSRKIRKLESCARDAVCKSVVKNKSATTIADHDLKTLASQNKLQKKATSGSKKIRNFKSKGDVVIESTDNKEGPTSQLDKESTDHSLNEISAISVPGGSDKIEKVCKKKKKRKQRNGRTLQVGEDDNYSMSETSIGRVDVHANSFSSNTKKHNTNIPVNPQVECPRNETSVECGHWQSSSSEQEEETATQVKNPSQLDMCQWKNLLVSEVLQQALQDEGLDSPTPIQTLVLPSAIRDRRDILAAAETGSGKTLAFGIPVFERILNMLEDCRKEDLNRNVQFHGKDLNTNSGKLETNGVNRPPLALILEPTRELAVQVKKHLTALAKYTDIKIATVVGGMSIEKQRRIMGKKPHVVIATPGRLWQLIEEGNDHLVQLDKVLCLVVDEADRMIEKGHYEELTKLMEMMNKSSQHTRKRQTFVMSATLTMDIGAPKWLGNKMKKKAIVENKLKTLTDRICMGSKPKVLDLTPKDKVSHTLTELRVNCKAEEKDFYLYYFLCQHSGRTLVFANSKDCVRRLISLLTLLQCSPLPLHADMQQRQRLKNLDKFADNSRGLLVASDVAARGLDIANVDHVIHYQIPRTMENYIHRSGRTARALNLGLSVMLVAPEEARDYRKIVHGVRNGQELALLPIEGDLLPAVKQRVTLARTIDVQEYRIKKKRLRNNFFTKAAEDMDMIIDDTNLLEDMGDLVEQAEHSHQLKQMKAQLVSLLRGSLMPLHMTKYPTKSGQLLSHHNPVNLHSLR